MLNIAKNSKQQGNIGVACAIAYFVSSGYAVSIPLGDNQRYDLIVDIDGVLHKTQVKTSTVEKRPGVYEVLLKTCGGNQSWGGVCKFFDGAEVDLLFIVCNNGDQYCIPTNTLKNRSRITVGNKYTEYKIGG